MAAILDEYGRPARRPNRKEIAGGYGRLQVMEGLDEWANPDDYAREEGLAAYDKVAKDSHVKSVWNTRLDALAGCPREWHAPEGMQPDALPMQFLKWNFREAMRRSLSQVYKQAMRSATKNGYAVQELMWRPNYPRGPFAGATVLVDIRDRDSDRFILKPDGLYLKESWSDLDGKKVDSRKFWSLTFQGEYENPYGESLFSGDLRWYAWFKKNGMKFWLVFLEKFGMPTVKGVIPDGYSDDDEVQRVRNVLASIRGREAITVPEGFDVSLLEASKSGSAGAGYDLLIDVCDRQISKTILGQTLTTDEGKRSGSFAQGKVHADVRADILKADGEWMDGAVNFGPVVTLLDYNFSLEHYPTTKSQTEPGEDLNALAERDTKLLAAGVKISQKYFYDTYNLPEPQEGEELVNAPVARGSAPANAAEAFAEADEKKKRKAPTDPLYYGTLEQGVHAFHTAIIQPFKTALPQIFEHASAEFPQIERGADFAEFLTDVLISASLQGRWTVKQRLDAQKPTPDPSREGSIEGFAEGDDIAVETLKTGLTNVKALEFLQDKQLMPPDDFATLSKEAKATAFAVAEVEDARLLEGIKDELERAIEEGGTYADFEAAVNELFEKRGVDPMRPWHLENVFRTNIQSAYHAASYQMLHDPELGDLISYLQYDAIEDNRTRPAHAAVDGTILPSDDPWWDRWYPPNGYRCRCDVIPITKYEAANYTPTPKNEIPAQVDFEGQRFDVKPDNGFDVPPKLGAGTIEMKERSVVFD